MRIDSKDNLLGIPMLTIRNLLRETKSYYEDVWPESLACEVLKLDAEQTHEILDELANQEFVQGPETRSGEQFWRNTLKGNQLALASAARSVARETADKSFSDFMIRVNEVNENPYYLYAVTRVVLFGSYIRDTPKINDIDIAVQLGPKEIDLDRRKALNEKRRRESKRTFRTSVDYLAWPITEVWMFLKSRSRVISIHDYDLEQDLLKTTEIKVVLGENDR